MSATTGTPPVVRSRAPLAGNARRAARALLFVAALGLIASVVLVSRHVAYRRAVIASSKADLLSLTVGAARSIDALLGEATATIDSVASDLTAGRIATTDALVRLRAALEQHPHHYGATVTFTPYAFDARRRLYSAYLAKKSGKVEFIQLDTVYDYTKPEYEWFGPAIAGGPLWTQPYYDEAAATWMVTYSVPFYGPDPPAHQRTALGVVTVDLAMDEIGRIIESLNLGPTGFGTLVSQKGVYLYHPDADMVRARKSLLDVGRENRDEAKTRLADRVARRETGIVDDQSEASGLAAWVIYAPIPSTGWSLQNTFVRDDLPWDIDRLRRQLIQIAIVVVVFAAAAIALLTGAYTGKLRRLWAASVATAVLLAAAIGYLWSVSLAFDSHSRGEGVRVSDAATVHNLMNAYTRRAASAHTEPPVYLPTGIFVESAAFSAPDDLSVAGYLWQKYTIGAHDAVTRGVTISNATDLTVTENYRQTEGGVEVVRWHFSGTFRQRIDHAKYPLEQETIGLRLVHKDLNRHVVLVPDLAAYRFTNPTALPGLDKGLVLPGWQMTHSFFELRSQRFDTNFGLERSLAGEQLPSLYFDIVIKRVFVDAFISNLTALIIVTVLSFTLLMIAIKDERLVGFMQAGSGRVLNICVAMFFVIAFSHIDIRRKIAAEEVFYLEYFYFLIYLAILWVSINSVLFAMGRRIRLIQYRDNLISQLLFWPLLLGSLFAITAVTFY